LLLELRHAVQPAHARDAVEHPRKFRMARNLALVEDDRLVGIDTGGEIGTRDLADIVGQFGRILPQRDGVHVDDAIDARILILQRHETPDGAEIIAEMQVAGGLDARKDARRELGHYETIRETMKRGFSAVFPRRECPRRAAWPSLPGERCYRQCQA